jgi:hypothetical protein
MMLISASMTTYIGEKVNEINLMENQIRHHVIPLWYSQGF